MRRKYLDKRFIVNGRDSKINLDNRFDITLYIHEVIRELGGMPTLVSNVNGSSGSVNVTAASIGLGNVNNTSDINKPVSIATQNALDLKQDKNITVISPVSNRALLLSDSGNIILMNFPGINSLEVPLDSIVNFPIGAQIIVTQTGIGVTTITAAVSVTLNSADNLRSLRTQYSSCTLIKTAVNTWLLIGDLA